MAQGNGYAGGTGPVATATAGGHCVAQGVACAAGPDASATTAAVESLTVDDVFKGLADFRSLTRERALATLRVAVQGGRFSAEEVQPLVASALQADSWEARQGGLLAAAEAVQMWDDKSFRSDVLKEVPRLLLDAEYRVRKAVAGVLRECSRRDGLAVYDELQDRVLGNIRETFQRAPSTEEETAGADGAPPPPPTFLPDTEGWRTLETSMGALEAMMLGCGEAFSPKISEDLLALLAECSRHTNRFVREYAFFAYRDTFTVCSKEVFLTTVAPATVKLIAKGIQDNWSQVRYAGSVAVRAFVEKAGDAKEQFFPDLLGPMCLNRHYVAEGVRLYSQDTWKAMCGPQGGVRFLMAHFDQVIEDYGKAARAPNHAVREAACHCICELGKRVAGTPSCPTPFREHFTEPRIARLMETLVQAFSDESWPVRDVASTAVGFFVASFPTECASFQSQLIDMWFDQIQDNIPSLRQNGAASLATAVGAWPSSWSEVVERLEQLLPVVEQQTAASRIFQDYTPSGPFSVPRPKATTLEELRQGVDTRNTNQAMYSCGSMAPKTFKRKLRLRDAGCMNCNIDTPSQPWEASEGMAHLLVELASLTAAGKGLSSCAEAAGSSAEEVKAERLDKLAALGPLLVRALKCSHYDHSYCLKQRIFERLPPLTEALGPSRLSTELPELLKIVAEGMTQRMHQNLYEAARCALLTWRRTLPASQKQAAAAALEVTSLDEWIDKSLKA
eukprot:TRINITY_DN31755_c0_g1_i1.p1 TRINITY_DN31755_c0_g1~~TRINITY_DN31755_c0_g1_i1.p1  ORF type:complete len:732 (-),score=150.97 TRINITY_DN31755_c0_g1_i1:197-2392(-)